MSTERIAIASLPDCAEAAYERVSYGINLLNLLAIEDSLVRLTKKDALPSPDVLQTMREALVEATVLSMRDTLESANDDVLNFWKALCEFAQQAGLASGERASGEIWKSPLVLKDPRAVSLLSYLRSVENLRRVMFSETGSAQRLAEIPAIIAEGDSSRMSIVTPADRAAALDDISRAVALSFDLLVSQCR
ncbi:MAG: hypothetical protein AB2L14_16075 [Candidatus Xenobiia bacterium LiM19]